MTTTTALTKNEPNVMELVSKHEEGFAKIDAVLSQVQGIGPEVGKMQKTLIVAAAMNELTKYLKPALPLIRSLINSPIGFKCDKDNYDDDTILACAAGALIKGFQLFDNEWNIIAGNFMAVRNGLRRQCLEHPKARKIDFDSSVPQSQNGKMLVECVMRYEHQNESGEWITAGFSKMYSVRVNSGQGDDAILGKAERRAYKTLLEKLTGGVIKELGDDGLIDEDDKKPHPKSHSVIMHSPPTMTVQKAEPVEPVELGDVLHLSRLAQATLKDLPQIRKDAFAAILVQSKTEDAAAALRLEVLAAIDARKQELKGDTKPVTKPPAETTDGSELTPFENFELAIESMVDSDTIDKCYVAFVATYPDLKAKAGSATAKRQNELRKK